MPKYNKGLDEQMLEGGVGGGMSAGFRSAKSSSKDSGPVKTNTPWLGNERVTGSRSAKDNKEARDYEQEISGEVGFKSPKRREDFDRTPMTSDDYKNGGMTASKRADGIAQRGKTRGSIC